METFGVVVGNSREEINCFSEVSVLNCAPEQAGSNLLISRKAASVRHIARFRSFNDKTFLQDFEFQTIFLWNSK